MLYVRHNQAQHALTKKTNSKSSKYKVICEMFSRKKSNYPQPFQIRFSTEKHTTSTDVPQLLLLTTTTCNTNHARIYLTQCRQSVLSKTSPLPIVDTTLLMSFLTCPRTMQPLGNEIIRK